MLLFSQIWRLAHRAFAFSVAPDAIAPLRLLQIAISVLEIDEASNGSQIQSILADVSAPFDAAPALRKRDDAVATTR